MFSRVLIATEASPASLAVVACAGALHQVGAEECVLAQCFQIREHVPFPDEIKAYIESSLEREKRKLERQGLSTTIAVTPGFPGTTIPRLSEEQGCSLIVVGSHGHNLASEILLGGTATEILHHPRTPVLVVRLTMDENSGQAVCAGGGCDFIRHVLYATDFSDHSQHAFDYVSELVKYGARHVTLLHVQDKAKLGKHLEHRLGEFNDIDRDRLSRLADRLRAVGDPDIEMEIPYGSPIDEILKRTAGNGASLVVMGSHGRGFFSEVFIGSVSHNVARHAETPVLLVPGPVPST